MRSAVQRLTDADAHLSTAMIAEIAALRKRLDDVSTGERELADQRGVFVRTAERLDRG